MARTTPIRDLAFALLLLCVAGRGAAETPSFAAAPTADKSLAAQPESTRGPHEAPEETVRRLCEARKALDAAQLERLLAEDYHGEQPDGSKTPYDRDRGRHIAEWERVMNTRWDYRILGVDGNAVTVLLSEQSDYFDLLGIGTRTQVTVYFVDAERVSRSLSKLDVQERGSQAKEFRRFHAWLLQQLEHPEPDLVGPDGRLIFDGKGAARMLFWLKRWRAAQD